MARYLVQSLDTGLFLCPNINDGSPEWVSALNKSGGGVVSDYETAIELSMEYSEIGERINIIDIDKLGTSADYI